MKIFTMFFFIIIFFTAALLQAQSRGTITGTILDSETGETIIGANVLLEGTTIGAATDI